MTTSVEETASGDMRGSSSSNNNNNVNNGATVIPSYTGLPTQLIRKRTLVQADSTTGRLPVHTLTFAIPSSSTDDVKGGDGGVSRRMTEDGPPPSAAILPHEQVAIDLGDVVKLVIPNYKPKSYSISALRIDQNEFDVTLKVYPNGRASGVLDRLNIGDCIYSFGKSANRTRNPGSYVGIIVFGVGITEGLPVARAECEKLTKQSTSSSPSLPSSSGEGETKSTSSTTITGSKDIIINNTTSPKVKLLWASRTMEDTFWHDDIRILQEEFPSVFEIVYLLSREEREGCLHGHITPQLLGTVFQPPIREEARFLSVGTKEMMRLTDTMLTEIGYPMPQHHLLPKKGGGNKKDKHRKDEKKQPKSEEL